ncbi:MAG TPA: hypothetical protein EYP65_07495 [Armatimonadetes bacterium]|nr:hypothetical protein [Armatimonadota bacterium]
MALVMAFLAKVLLVDGWHGGYFLTDVLAYREALERLFSLLEGQPKYKAAMELEPYTLEAMLYGERFEVERRGREKPTIVGWSWSRRRGRAAPQRDAARLGSYGVRLELPEGVDWINLCQPKPAAGLEGKRLIFSGWIRALKGRGAHLYIDAWDEAGFIPGSARVSDPVPPDGRWHFVKVEFIVPYGAVTIFPQAKITGGPGVADFDGLSLEVVETGEELLENGGFEETRMPSLRDLENLRRLRRWIRRGRLEIVGGAYSQPILYAIGQEAVLREFLLGTRAVEEALGATVKVYAAQEPDWVGQIPQILKGFGFRAVLYRTHWGAFGSAPPKDAEVVLWEGPCGARIACIPHPSPIWRPWGSSAPNPRSVAECKRLGIKTPLFTFFHDFSPRRVHKTRSLLARGILWAGWAHVCLRMDATRFRGRTLIFSGWIRARKPGAHLYIDAHDARGRVPSGAYARSPDVRPDGRWHKVAIRLRVPESAVHLFPQGRIISAEGDADFDGLSLEVEGEGKGLLPNPSFEEGLEGGWSIGHSQGVEAEGEVVEGEAAHGRKFVRLRMRSRAVRGEFVTLEEYLEIVGEPKEVWRDAYQGFVHRFPFGLLGGRQQRADREAEDSILRTERLYAIVGRDPGEDIWDAWRLLLIGHHHDAWVCAPVVFGLWRWGFKRYADLSLSACREARKICKRLTEALEGDDPLRLVLVNVCGFGRREFVNVKLTLPDGLVRLPALKGPDGNLLPAVVEVRGRHPDGTAKEAEIWALLDLPPMGYVRCEVVDGKPPEPPRARAKRAGEGVVLENRLVRVEVRRGGLFLLSPEGELLTGGPVHIAGRFQEGDEVWEITEARPGRRGPFAIAEGRGRIGRVPFTFEASLSPLSPLVKLAVEFDFGEGVVVGEGEPLPPGRKPPSVPVWARDDCKLRLCVPLPFHRPEFLAHNAFELRRPHDVRFPILRFAVAREGERVVAVYTDRQTAGVFRKGPRPSLEVVLAYGGRFIYAPHEFAPLRGRERYELALLFGRGDLESLRVAQVAEELAHPALVLRASPSFPRPRFSLLSLEPEGAVVLTAAYIDGGRLLLRLWRPYRRERGLTIRVAGATEIRPCDMRGRPEGGPLDGERAVIRMREAQIVNLVASLTKPST